MSEQLTFDDMPRRLFACTPSRLESFACPRFYGWTYLVKPTPPRGLPWARSTIGAVAHVALHRWWLLPRSQRVPERGIELVERNWSGYGFRDERQSARTSELVADWVADYLRTKIDPADEPVGVERTVAARTARLALSGRVDRIDDRDGELVVVDYKTGVRPPTPADAANSRALALYAVGVEHTLRRRCRRVELHHLPTGTIAAHEHTDESLAAHVAAAERTADAIEAATAARSFPPAPDPSCSWCDFRKVCPEGRAASVERQPWDGLPSEAG